MNNLASATRLLPRFRKSRWVGLVALGIVANVAAQQLRPGVSAAQTPETLPLATHGYEAYLVGELHGLDENETFAIQYLKLLHKRSGLRDVAIEEDAVYEHDAQAFVDGRSLDLPSSLCLRAGVLRKIRQFNTEVVENERIRVHLTDIDSPAPAILRHLEAIKIGLQAHDVPLPNISQLKESGVAIVNKLRQQTTDPIVLSQLRTAEFSLAAYREGLAVDTGPFKGSPYLESREQAVAANIADLLRVRKIPSLLVLYGADHVSRTQRKDGGPNRDASFNPMALRLKQSGVKAFSVIAFPLEGRSFWRGRANELVWTPADGHLASGETLAHLIASAPGMNLFSIDVNRERIRLPSQDISAMEVDAFLLFRSGSPMANHCNGGSALTTPTQPNTGSGSLLSALATGRLISP